MPLETLRAKARNVALPAPQKGSPSPPVLGENGAQIPGAKRRPFPFYPLAIVPRKWARFVAQVLASEAILGKTIDTYRRPLPPGNGTERVPFLVRCGLFSGGIAICAYAQTLDELRQDPFEMGEKRD